MAFASRSQCFRNLQRYVLQAPFLPSNSDSHFHAEIQSSHIDSQVASITANTDLGASNSQIVIEMNELTPSNPNEESDPSEIATARRQDTEFILEGRTSTRNPQSQTTEMEILRSEGRSSIFELYKIQQMAR